MGRNGQEKAMNAPAATPKTLADKVHQALRRDILTGVFAPDSPLRLAALSARYGMGFSPLREALNRLEAERLVTAESLRGFRVAPWSPDAFEDALDTRLLIETDALRLAIRRNEPGWAEGLRAALAALAGADGPPDPDIWDLEARHHAFHRALLAGCGSAWRMAFFERLYHATERYRLPVLMARTGLPRRDIAAEHAALAAAALAGDAEGAATLLRSHYQLTAETIRAGSSKKPD